MHTQSFVLSAPFLHDLDDLFHFLKPQDAHHNSRRRAKVQRWGGTPVKIDPQARRAAVLEALAGEFWLDVRSICERCGLRPGAVRRTLARLMRSGEVVWRAQPRCWNWKSRLYSSRMAAFAARWRDA